MKITYSLVYYFLYPSLPFFGTVALYTVTIPTFLLKIPTTLAGFYGHSFAFKAFHQLIL